MTISPPPLPRPSREHSAESRAQVAAIAARREARQRYTRKPAHWLKPSYASQQYRYAVAVGWISDDEQRADHEAHQKRRETAIQSRGRPAPARTRDSNPAPLETRQYGRDYGTEHLRDSRLTPNARNLLGLIRARCGDGIQTAFTKGTMANCLGVSVRSIQRYVQELIKYGYIVAEIRRGFFGLHTGLVVRIAAKVRPYYAKEAMETAWLKDETRRVLGFMGRIVRNPGRTEVSCTKSLFLYPLMFGSELERNPPSGG